jgi:hypothetical protein
VIVDELLSPQQSDASTTTCTVAGEPVSSETSTLPLTVTVLGSTCTALTVGVPIVALAVGTVT